MYQRNHQRLDKLEQRAAQPQLVEVRLVVDGTAYVLPTWGGKPAGKAYTAELWDAWDEEHIDATGYRFNR